MNDGCLIHIGAPKTGSTQLQRMLFDNREALEDVGVRYPDVSLRGYGHHDLAFVLSGGYPQWAVPQERTLAQLADELRERTAGYGGRIIISSENFYLYPAPEALRDLLEQTGILPGRAVTVIAYVRRQDDAHESWYNQTIKAQGYTHTLAESVQRFDALWDYERQLDRWAAVFGTAAIRVRPYEEAQFAGGTLESDFFDVLGVNAEALRRPPQRVNTRINGDLLEFQRMLNRLPLETVEKRKFHRELMELSARTEGSGLFDESALLSAAERNAILDRYRDANAAVAKTYLGRERLFFDAPDTTPEGYRARPLDATKLAYIVGWLLSRR